MSAQTKSLWKILTIGKISKFTHSQFTLVFTFTYMYLKQISSRLGGNRYSGKLILQIENCKFLSPKYLNNFPISWPIKWPIKLPMSDIN